MAKIDTGLMAGNQKIMFDNEKMVFHLEDDEESAHVTVQMLRRDAERVQVRPAFVAIEAEQYGSSIAFLAYFYFTDGNGGYTLAIPSDDGTVSLGLVGERPWLDLDMSPAMFGKWQFDKRGGAHVVFIEPDATKFAVIETALADAVLDTLPAILAQALGTNATMPHATVEAWALIRCDEFDGMDSPTSVHMTMEDAQSALPPRRWFRTTDEDNWRSIDYGEDWFVCKTKLVSHATVPAAAAIIWNHDPLRDEDSIVAIVVDGSNPTDKVAELTKINSEWQVSDSPHINMPAGSVTHYATGPNPHEDADEDEAVIWYITLMPLSG